MRQSRLIVFFCFFAVVFAGCQRGGEGVAGTSLTSAEPRLFVRAAGQEMTLSEAQKDDYLLTLQSEIVFSGLQNLKPPVSKRAAAEASKAPEEPETTRSSKEGAASKANAGSGAVAADSYSSDPYLSHKGEIPVTVHSSVSRPNVNAESGTESETAHGTAHGTADASVGNIKGADSLPPLISASLQKAEPLRERTGPPPMEIHSICTSEGNRYERIKLQPYQSNFYILDLLPRQLLLVPETRSPASCSFLFILRDAAGNVYSYLLAGRFVGSLSAETFLQLRDEKSRPPRGLIGKSAMSGFQLIMRSDGKADRLQFLCEGLEDGQTWDSPKLFQTIAPFRVLQALSLQEESGQGAPAAAAGESPPASQSGALSANTSEISPAGTSSADKSPDPAAPASAATGRASSASAGAPPLKMTVWGKRRCRIMTYKKVRPSNSTGYYYKANGISGFFEFDFQALKEQEPSPDFAKTNPRLIFVVRKSDSQEGAPDAGRQAKLRLPFFKSDEGGVSSSKEDSAGPSPAAEKSPGGKISAELALARELYLSDEIFFADQEGFPLKTPSRHSSGGPGDPGVQIKTVCLVAGKDQKRLEKQTAIGSFRFKALSLMPEELLRNGRKEDAVSCSFDFTLKDARGAEHKGFRVSSLPIQSIEQAAFVQLWDMSAGSAGGSAGGSGLGGGGDESGLLRSGYFSGKPEPKKGSGESNTEQASDEKSAKGRAPAIDAGASATNLAEGGPRSFGVPLDSAQKNRPLSRNDLNNIVLALPHSKAKARAVRFFCIPAEQASAGKDAAEQPVSETSASADSITDLASLNSFFEKRFELQNEKAPFPPFVSLLSAEKSDLPSRLNTCRVAVYGGEPEILIGLSGRISVDFDSVRQSEKPQWKPKAGAVEIRTESEGALSRNDRQGRLDEADKRRSHPVYINSVFRISKLFEGLPEDFQDHQSYMLRAETKCFSAINQAYTGFQREKYLETYYLPLSESFPVMSVTPAEAFQPYFPADLPRLLRNVREKYLRTETEVSHTRRKLQGPARRKAQEKSRNDKQWITCSWRFQVQIQKPGLAGAEEKTSLIPLGEIQNQRVFWRRGGYGLDFRGDDMINRRAQMSFPLSLSEAMNLSASPLFLNDPSQKILFPSADFSEPYIMDFICGGRHPSHEYQPPHDVFYESLPAVSHQNPLYAGVPLRTFLQSGDFQSYLAKNHYVKCRLILQKNGIVRYFSQELKIIDDRNERFYDELNRDRLNNSKKVRWNRSSLSRYLYWL